MADRRLDERPTNSTPAQHCCCHAGLAVADDGARVFIVGGRAELEAQVNHACRPRDGTESTAGITSGVFELDLGQNFLGGDPLRPGA